MTRLQRWSSSISAPIRRTRLSWTLWRQRRTTRRLARQVERLKQELATLQVMAAERVERGKALERRLYPLLAGPEPENQVQERVMRRLLLPDNRPEPPQLPPPILRQPEPEPTPPPLTPAEVELAQLLGL